MDFKSFFFPSLGHLKKKQATVFIYYSFYLCRCAYKKSFFIFRLCLAQITKDLNIAKFLKKSIYMQSLLHAHTNPSLPTEIAQNMALFGSTSHVDVSGFIDVWGWNVFFMAGTNNKHKIWMSYFKLINDHTLQVNVQSYAYKYVLPSSIGQKQICCPYHDSSILSKCFATTQK